jgi:Uncharacterized membrane protein
MFFVDNEVVYIIGFTQTLGYLKELNMVSIIVRFLFAIICGGIIGIERGKKRQAAGLRTHLLVCIGSAAIMMVNQYISVYLDPTADMSRMGAQVISGIGFLGAGTIIITGHRQIKGLTTAAGLWASSAMGLAIGIGYYECAIIMCIFLYIVLQGLNKLDEKFLKGHTNVQLYLEYDETFRLSCVLEKVRNEGWHMAEIEHINKNSDGGSMQVTITNERKIKSYEELLEHIREMNGVLYIEEF